MGEGEDNSEGEGDLKGWGWRNKCDGNGGEGDKGESDRGEGDRGEGDRGEY
jgi:hypothetical protein